MASSNLYLALSGIASGLSGTHSNFKSYDNNLSTLIPDINSLKNNLLHNIQLVDLYPLEAVESNTVEPGHIYNLDLSANLTLNALGGAARKCWNIICVH